MEWAIKGTTACLLEYSIRASTKVLTPVNSHSDLPKATKLRRAQTADGVGDQRQAAFQVKYYIRPLNKVLTHFHAEMPKATRLTPSSQTADGMADQGQDGCCSKLLI